MCLAREGLSCYDLSVGNFSCDHAEKELCMTPYQRIWAAARDRLAEAVAQLGYPEELAGLLAGQLGSPKAIDRMTAYLNLARPRSVEMIVDEMLAITSEIDSWREKKESLEAQEGYSAWLNSETRRRNGEDP